MSNREPDISSSAYQVITAAVTLARILVPIGIVVFIARLV